MMPWRPGAARRWRRPAKGAALSNDPPLSSEVPARQAARAGAATLVLLLVVTLAGLAWVTRQAESVPAGGTNSLPASASPESLGRAITVEDLRRQAERYPRNGRGWALLGYAEFEAERYAEAAAAFEKAVAVSPKVAADPGVWCDWADALGMAQGGSLKGRPEELVARALELQSTHPKALEMAGSAAYERRDFATSAGYWRQLLPQLEETSPRRRDLEAAIARAERLAATSLPATR